MKYQLSQLSARIRAICILSALFLVPDIVQAATDVYLLTAEDINGTTGNYNVPSNHQFTNSSGSVYTYTITSMPATGFSFRIGVNGWINNMQPYQNDDPLTINGASYKIQDGCYGENNAWKVSYTKGEYKSLTITVDLSTTPVVKITGVKNTGGGTSTTVNQPGIYLYGSAFGATSSTDRLHYKFVRKNDSEYHFALYAGSMQYKAHLYGGSGDADITPSWNNKSFTIAYIDADGNFSTFCPSGNYTLTGSDTNAAKDFGSNTQWTIQDNGGMYDLVVKVDADGKPTSWYYQSDPNRLVAYKASSTSNWTTEGFLYCVKVASSDAKAYNQNFFGTTPMVKDEEFKFILGNYWFGKRDDNETYDLNVSIANGSTDAPNLKSPYDGIYPIEFNPSRTDYQLAGKDKTPLRIFMIGSALNSSLSDTYTDWDPTQAAELVYDKDEQCYKGTVSLAKGKQFRFLRDKNASGSATSLDLNFGEDSNKPGEGGDTNENNHVAYNDNSTKGTNVVFNPETNTYNVRFYIEAGTDMSSFNWNSAKYRYTIELPTRLNATITPPSATVAYGASLTPKVNVVGSTSTTATGRTYAYTLDGSDPVINTTTGEAGNTATKVVNYTPDEVIPTNDLGTFYMNPDNELTFIDNKGTSSTLPGNTVTVKAQAVQTITENSKYRLEGNIATGTYTFKTAGIKPAGNYTISVTNDNQTDKPSINKVTATVTVKNTVTNTDDGVDVYYTIDGTDPAKVGNPGARLVNKNRKIEVYGIAYLEHGAENRIRVAIAGSEPLGDIGDETTDDDVEDGTTHASCKFDLTCSTSEGGYINYRDGYTDPKLKTYGGDGHIVVYILPWSSNYGTTSESNRIWVQNALEGYRSKEDLENTDDYDHNIDDVAGLRVPFIYAYENIVEDGVVKSKALTHATHTIDVFTDMAVGLPTIPNQENQEEQDEQEEQETYPPYCWYYVDLVPDDNYKEVNVEVGYYDLVTGESVFTPATIANVHNDMFLKFDVATGQIEDVTHEYTKDHFYTTGPTGTKSEPANPKAGEHFFYAQVPEAWTINDNSVKVYQNGKELSGATVNVQGSSETSCLSKVCKISVPASLAKGTSLTIQPYHDDKTSTTQKLTVNYVNGGYYFYESATHNTPNAPLVFGADADGDKDQRPKGRRDVNHTLETQPAKRVAGTGYMGYGDYTYYLTPNWTYSGTTETPTTKTVDDNWNGKQATVNTIAAGTTISTTVEGLPTEGNQFTVQMIVRGTEGAEATLKLVGSEYTHTIYTDDESSQEIQVPYKNASASVSKTFAGYDAQGTVTTDGRVEYLLKTDKKNGWQKLETKAAVGEEGKLTISLTAEGGDLQLSDVTLLCNANTPPEPIKGDNGNIVSYNYYPTIWTSAPTNSDVTEYDLTDRQGANEFSFFDRGDNRNAVIYADKNTVLGMSKNTYNVAVPIGYKNGSNNAKHRPVFRGFGYGESSEPSFSNATGHTLAFYDKPDDWDNEHTWGTSHQITWDNFSWDRNFYSTREGSGERNTIFLPFKMDENQIKKIFGDNATIYSITKVDTKNLTVTGTPVTQKDPNTGEQVTGTAPNVPYIVELREPKNGVSYDDTSDKLVTYYSKYDSQSSDISGKGDFVGVYKYTKFNTKSDDSYDYYCYGAERNGIFDHFSDEGADIKPFRAYLRINRSAGSKPFYYFIVNDNETTGIEGVNASTLNEDAPVYNLQGQVIRQAGQHAPLPKGVYIQNGRKFMQQ